MIVHQVPARSNGKTLCCQLSFSKLPHVDRMTRNPDRATCTGRGGPYGGSSHTPLPEKPLPDVAIGLVIAT